MKRVMVLALALIVGFVIGQLFPSDNVIAYQYIQEMYTDGITESGVSKNISFHILVMTDEGNLEWHYFGSDPDILPPTTAHPVYEHSIIQFPRDLDELAEANDYLYELGLQAGLNREGLN